VQRLRRVRAVMRKELRTLLRDRFYLFMGLLLPVITLVIMGYGMTSDVRNLPLGVLDLDQSVESRRFVDAFAASGYFRLVTRAWSMDALEDELQAGRVRTAVVIPPGFARALYRGQPAQSQILVDASFLTRAEIARGYAEAIVAEFNHERLQAARDRAPAGLPDAVDLDVVGRVWYNPALETKNYIVPGLVVVSLLFWAPLLVTLSVTREKESGAILNVQTVPLARWEFIVGKLVPYAAITFAGYFLLLLASVALFRVPLKGSVTLLTAAALIYVVAMTGLGLLVSVLVRTQIAALLVTGTLVMAVGLFYAGWLSPLETLDRAGQLVGRTLPTADFMTLVRGVFLKGLGWNAYAGTLLALGVYAVLFVLLPILGFRKRRR